MCFSILTAHPDKILLTKNVISNPVQQTVTPVQVCGVSLTSITCSVDAWSFSMQIEHISAYKKPRPQFVLVSSAAVERSNRARTPEQRDRSIPIVKLNPGQWFCVVKSCQRFLQKLCCCVALRRRSGDLLPFVESSTAGGLLLSPPTVRLLEPM